MPMDPEALYLQLGNLVATTPDLKGLITPEIQTWLGRAAVLVEAAGDTSDSVNFNTAVNYLSINRAYNAHQIVAIVHRALARAEANAPAAARGAFIPAGGSFDALAVVAKVLTTATTDVLMIDPYADEKVLTDFAVLAPELVKVRVLADAGQHKPSLKPAAERWAKQHGAKRPLEVRLAPAKSLHDRLILIDGAAAWNVGQSFNALAARAPTSLVRADEVTAQMKVQAYESIWSGASAL